MNKRAMIITGLVCAALVGGYAYNEYSFYRKAPYLVLRRLETTYPKTAFAASYKVEFLGKNLVHCLGWEGPRPAARE